MSEELNFRQYVEANVSDQELAEIFVKGLRDKNMSTVKWYMEQEFGMRGISLEDNNIEVTFKEDETT